MEEIRYFITHEDYWHFRLYALFRVRGIILLLVLLLLVIALFVIMLQRVPFALDILFTLLFVILLIALMAFRMWRNSAKAAQASQKRGAIILNISAEGLRQRNDISDSTTSWKAIKEIQQDKHNFYFVLDSPGTNVLMAFLIPRHVFASSEGAEHFIGRARGYWQEQAGQIATTH
jgi:membrane protein implicated in regulation of membrane protease activity